MSDLAAEGAEFFGWEAKKKRIQFSCILQCPMSAASYPGRFSFLHIGPNSFFASVEQQLPPEYRGRPLAVVPTMADTTCCIAASYEAKALGIKTGTQVGKAKEICPEIILIAGDHADYAEYSHRIAKAVELECPVSHT